MRVHSKLSFTVSETDKQTLREDLSKGADWMRRTLESLSADDELATRVSLCERYILRQSQAQNPDTLLMQRLCAYQRGFIDHFKRHRDDWDRCKLIEKNGGTLPDFCAPADQLTQSRQLLHYRAVDRMLKALMLAGMLCAERRLPLTIDLLLAEADLLVMLVPGHPMYQTAAPFRRQWERSGKACGEHLLRARTNEGYKLFFRHDDDEQHPLFAFHEHGAFAAALPDHAPYEIDFKLFTQDRDSLPDIRHPVDIVDNNWGIDGYLYVDCLRRDRKIIYDPESDAYTLAE